MRKEKQFIIKYIQDHKEYLFIIFMFLLFIIIRSIHFSQFLDFSNDQGFQSSEVLRIWRDKSLVLIGPCISFNLQGLTIFTGGAVYYFQLIFLLLGGFDPIRSSYIFMLFSALMIIPLYYGVKILINQRAAICLAIIYTLFPFYIDFTRFLWNPNFQFALLPGLIYLMSLYKRKKRHLIFFLIGIYSGFLFQFHYQFVPIILGIVIYYNYIRMETIKNMFFLFIGICIGVSPLIIFELRHNFYNTRIFVLLLSKGAFLAGGGHFDTYFLLSISLFIFLIICFLLNRLISKYFLFILFWILLALSCIRYLPNNHNFFMGSNWNYLSEEKAHEIIMRMNIKNFNVVNLAHDTDAYTQKYLLYKDNIQINSGNYYHNEYLFAIAGKNDLEKSTAYEVTNFRPAKLIKKWQLNKTYDLYLLQKIKNLLIEKIYHDKYTV